MEYIKLKDLCEKEERFVTPNDDAHIDYVDISSVDNKSKSLTKYDTYIFAEAPSRARKRVKHGDVIVSTVRPNLNAVARFNIQTPHTPIASTGFCVLRHKSDVDPIYIYFFCISPNFVRQMVAKATGASYPAVSDTIVREAKLPKHTAEKRVRIVSTLSKAKEIIEHRRAQLAKLDELVKCRFVEMFGDVKNNPYGWVSATVDSVTKEIIGGVSVSGETRKIQKGELAVLKVSAVTYGVFKCDEYKVISNDIKLGKYVSPKKGDLLFSRANTKELVGATALVDKDYPHLLLPDKIWKIVVSDKVSPVYLKAYLSEPWIRELMSKVATGTSGSMYNISMEKLRQIPVILPPIEQQNTFTTFVRRIDKLRFIAGRKKSFEHFMNK